jgi:hypothetical protein
MFHGRPFFLSWTRIFNREAKSAKNKAEIGKAENRNNRKERRERKEEKGMSAVFRWVLRGWFICLFQILCVLCVLCG